MPSRREWSARAPERFAIAAVRERWLEFLELEHATLAPAAAFERDGDELLVRREAVGGRPVAEGRIPRAHAPALMLQGAAAAAFFAAHGFPLSSEDLDEAAWDGATGDTRLWLTATPRSLALSEPASSSTASALRCFLDRLFARGGRLETPGARELSRSLCLESAPSRRPEFWVAAVVRAFPDLALPAFAGTRQRCLGFPGPALRSVEARAAAAMAAAILGGGEPRLFRVAGSPIAPGSALGFEKGVPRDAREAGRRLRAEAARFDVERRPVWIAVDRARWDSLSRAAFDAAAARLRGRVEVVAVEGEAPLPAGPDGWRRALWVPCGALSASVRFIEWLATLGIASRAHALEVLREFLGSPGYARFLADPTGDAPLPAAMAARPAAAPVRGARPIEPAGPGGRIERALAEGRIETALDVARDWIRSEPLAHPESWFSVSSLLAAHAGDRVVPWLEALEAEREIAGGRPRDARVRLERLSRQRVDEDERRRAALRSAEVAVALGEASLAARRAAAWRREYPDAPAAESVRALRLGAVGLAREGRTDCALALLEEADSLGASLDRSERLETGLTRARVFALAGRFADEDREYEILRRLAAESGDERLTARFLAQEARGLLDRREHRRALLRVDEALAVEDDPAERAALWIDRAAMLYHSGDPAASESALADAVESAAACGREDLACLARGNRIELLLDRAAFGAAEREIAETERRAREWKDDRALLVALHQRSRLALRRGDLGAAARDNEAARRLAESLGDLVEIGELWLEEGDRLACEGDREGARRAWTRAAEDPADRCDTAGTASRRLAELADGVGGPVGSASPPEPDALFAEDPFRAAEAVVRRCGLVGRESVSLADRRRAVETLRSAGAGALADLVSGSAASLARPSEAGLRALRGAVAGVLAGDGAGADGALRELGLEALVLRDEAAREVVRLGAFSSEARVALWRPLEAGASRFELALHPEVAEESARAIALVLETLLYRPSAAAAEAEDFAEGWRRLGLVTADAAMREPYRRLARFAPQPVTVLVLGESGSGKEAVARAVHRLSRRAAGPFVPVNLPAIPAALAESELFGHARGAFTGADRERRGLVEEANGGTIFLDEIGELAAPLQSKLLRALQEGEVRRVGENRPRSVDVRVVSATSRDLVREVEAGRFREDLFYRLHVAVIRLPPLRERGRDALVLARHFLDRCARDYGRGALRVTAETAAALGAYGWPGNVRELQNAMAQAAALGDADGWIGPELLPEPIRAAAGRRTKPSGDYRSRVDAHRRGLISEALDRSGGNRSRAARELGMSRQALLYLIKELGVAGRT